MGTVVDGINSVVVITGIRLVTKLSDFSNLQKIYLPTGNSKRIPKIIIIFSIDHYLQSYKPSKYL